MNKTNKLPLYLQLMNKLITKVNQGDYVEYEKLPSERELCDIYQLSRITIRQALQGLEREGYIYRKRGKGTFVAPKSFNQRLVNLYSFTEEMKKLGKKPKTKVLSFEKVAVDERLATNMAVDEGDEVFKITRLRLANEEPLMYETSFLPAKLFPNLNETKLINQPMYDVFSNHYRIGVTRATEQFSATAVDEKEAFFLKVAENQPAMLITRFAYDRDMLIEYTTSVARGDKFNYTVELS